MTNRLVGLGILAIGLMGGCSPQDRDREAVREVEQVTPPAAEPDTSNNDSTVTFPDTVAWKTGPAVKAGSKVATLMEVRTASHEGYDRIVFEFVGALPGYHIEYIDRPVRSCGSGEVVPMPGDAWLSMRFNPANAHTEQGQPTVLERQREWSNPAANLKALKLICDFEAVTEWVAGVDYPGRYRVLELSSPARIAVDVRRKR